MNICCAHLVIPKTSLATNRVIVKLCEQVADVVLSRALSAGGEMKKRLVIMDEVDGMGGSDRGGIQELIKVDYST